MKRPEDTLFTSFQRTRDPATLGEIYDLVSHELLHVALHLTGRPAEAEDVLQATFLVAIERADDFDPKRPLMPWLLGILTRKARAQQAKSRREPDPERLEEGRPHRVSEPLDEVTHGELDEQVQQAILKLPAAYQSALILRLQHGLSTAEIAHALRRPPGTVRSQITRGMELLRRTLPASFASGMLIALGRPAQGLSAIREAVVAQAAVTQAALTPLSILSGAMLMKNVVIAAGVVAVLAGGWKLLSRPAENRGLARPAAVVEPVELASVADEEESVELPQREEVPTEVESAAPMTAPEPSPAPLATIGTSALEVFATWLDDTPAEGVFVVVDVYEIGRPYPVHVVARTDLHGVARFDELPTCWAYARLLRGSQGGTQLSPGQVSSLSLKMFEGTTVEGVVVDGEGRVVPDADIWLSERWNWNRGYVVSSADGNGRFSLSSVSPDHYVGARARGFAHSTLRSVRSEAGERVELRLVLDREGTGVRGTVVDSRGAPVPRALVLVGEERLAMGERLEDGSFAPSSPPQWTHTDEDGAFALDHVPLGQVPVQARAPGHAPYLADFSIDSARENELRIVLEPEARLRGRITDARGEPLDGVAVHTTSGRFEYGQAVSNAKGEYELGGLRTGSVQIFAEKQGLDRLTAQLDLAPGDGNEWNPAFGDARRIFGRLFDQAGLPLERWTVVAVAGNDRHRSSQSDAEGHFTVGDLEEEAYTLWVQGPGGWRRFPDKVVQDVVPSTEPLDIRLDDPVTTTGRLIAEIVTADGDPVPTAKLTLWHDAAKLWREYPVDAESGLLEIERVIPGWLNVEVRSETHPWVRLGQREVIAGETLDLGSLVLEEPGFLTATIEGGSEESLVSLQAVMVDSENMEGGVMIREGRTLRSSPLAQGEYRLTVRANRALSRTYDVVITAGHEARQTLQLEPAAMRRVVFEKPEAARDPRNMWCSVFDSAGQQVWLGSALYPDERGILSANISAAPGSYRLIGRTNNGLRAEGRIEITAEEAEPLVVRLFRPEEE